MQAAVLEEFRKPLSIRDIDIPPIKEGELLVKVEAAGVCGSDIHIWEGLDPRIKLPLVLGHEGVGRVVSTGGRVEDIFGKILKAGDFIIWDRGVYCGRCFYCLNGEENLCPHRQVYGISRDGAYSTHILLDARTRVLKIEGRCDAVSLAAAVCSGATAAAALRKARMRPGDFVVVQGAGPLGMFACALAKFAGAGKVVLVGTTRSAARLELAYQFGVDAGLAIDRDDVGTFIREATGGLGADVVINCASRADSFSQGLGWVRRGGAYLVPGIAIPSGEVKFSIYEDLVLKDVRIEGVWVSKSEDLLMALRCVLSGRFPFTRFVDGRYRLSDINKAFEDVRERRVLKAVVLPSEE